jgi:uncharacterized membrane protein
MVQAIKDFFLETVGRELCVFFCSLLPIIELRGAIPLGAGLGLPWIQSFLLSIIGNLLPIPFILLLMRWVLNVMKRIKGLCNIALWLEAKAEKNREKVQKYAFWGLVLFVAIPLPGTGAWTGALVASVTGMRFWRSLLSVILGVLIAGVIMTAVSYGAVEAFAAWF